MTVIPESLYKALPLLLREAHCSHCSAGVLKKSSPEPTHVLQVRTSTIPGAGLGCFIDGNCKAGNLVGFFKLFSQALILPSSIFHHYSMLSFAHGTITWPSDDIMNHHPLQRPFIRECEESKEPVSILKFRAEPKKFPIGHMLFSDLLTNFDSIPSRYSAYYSAKGDSLRNGMNA